MKRFVVWDSPISAGKNELDWRSKLEQREARHLLRYTTVRPQASPSRLTLQTRSELSFHTYISNPASDLAALSTLELKIVWGAASAALSPITIFPSAEMSVGVTSQIATL